MNLAKYIDHTLLKPEATSEDIRRICKEAMEYGFYSVCINGSHVKTAYEILSGTSVLVCAVIGFPLGACSTKVKVFEAEDVIESGAGEIDMVINLSALKEENYNYVLSDIKSVVQASEKKAKVKVILENCLLEKEEIVTACNICVEAGAHFVKTSTGFNKGGATLDDIILMKKTVGDNALVKAAGGIKDYSTAVRFIDAGASRLGCSSSIDIIKGLSTTKDY